MNDDQRKQFDGMLSNIKPTKSPLMKFLKIIGVIAIVIILLIGATIGYVVYSDKKEAQERFEQTQAKAQEWVANKKPHLVLTRNDFGKVEQLSIWFVNDTDRHIIAKDNKQFYELKFEPDFGRAYGSDGYLYFTGKGGLTKGKNGELYTDCRVTSVKFDFTLYDVVKSDEMEPWNLPWNDCKN